MIQPPYRNPSFKTIESVKAKYISAKEVALLTSGGKVSERKTSLGAALKEPAHSLIKSTPILQRTMSEVSTKPPPISQRTSPYMSYMSALATPKSAKITCVPNETYAGDKISTSLCNETLIRRSVGVELHISPPKGKRAIGYADREEVSPSKNIKYKESITNLKSMVAVGTLAEQTAVDKPQWNCSYDVRSPQAHAPDKQTIMSHDEIALNDLTASSGYVSCLQEEDLTNRPASETCWKGTFEVSDNASHIYNGIHARMSAKASPKVRDILKKMPEDLKFKMLRRTDVWPKTFQYDPPDNKDIELYFFPSDQERPKEMYNLLLQWVDFHDFAMQSHISDIELLIFTSKQLLEDCQSEFTMLNI